jgi:transcriptional regulator with XRE-family HTH domain
VNQEELYLFASSSEEIVDNPAHLGVGRRCEDVYKGAESMPTVGDRIREIREESGITQERLAERAGLSKGFLSDVENNKRNVSAENLLKIANVFGASVDYLLRGDISEPSSAEPVIIPPELSRAAEELELSYAATIELLEAHKSVIARRSNRGLRKFGVEDWKELHRAIKRVFG